MRKVIEAKKMSDLKLHDYYSIHKYSKLTFAFNDVTDKIFEEGKFKKMPFLKDHVETCNETGKLILPISVDENVTREIYRRMPHADKSIVLRPAQQQRHQRPLQYGRHISAPSSRLLHRCEHLRRRSAPAAIPPFVSPISSRSGISFYRFFIEDTTYVDNASASVSTSRPTTLRTSASPVRSHILADSTYRIKKADLGIPRRSDVNFVESMRVIQGIHAAALWRTSLEERRYDCAAKARQLPAEIPGQTQSRNTTGFCFDPIPDKTFKFKGDQQTGCQRPHSSRRILGRTPFRGAHAKRRQDGCARSPARARERFQGRALRCQSLHRKLRGDECRPQASFEGRHRSRH